MNSKRFSMWGLMAGCLSALLLFAPAQWLADALHALSQGHVQLRDARGTVWTGNAQWVLTSGAGGQDALALPMRVHWQLRPDWQGLQLQIKADCCTPQPVQLRMKMVWLGVQLALSSPNSTWPAQWLAGLGAPWNTLAMEGELKLQSDELTWTWRQQDPHALLSGSAQLQLHQLSSGLSTVKPLGSYRLSLQGGEPPGVVLITTEGSLLIQGRGAWSQTGLKFEGEARANTGYESALANLLGVLGQRIGNRTVLRWG